MSRTTSNEEACTEDRRNGKDGGLTTPSRIIDVDALHFRALVGSSTYAIVTLDREQRFRSWNSGAQRLFRASAQQMIGKSLAVLLTEVDAPVAGLAGRIAQGDTVEIEARLRDLEGGLIDAFVTATPVRDESGDVVGSAMIIRDVTQAKQLERRLRESSQIEVVGRVAAGIAHDINNVLAIVQSYTEFVRSGPLTTEQSEDLRLAQDASKRGAQLTSQLLNLGRRRDLTPVDADVNELVKSLHDLLRRSLGHGVQFSVRLAMSPLNVRVPPGHVDQILMNLVLNARDAMPGGGALTLSLRSTVVNQTDPLSNRLKPGGYAVLAVSDTGCGMDPDTLSRIFEPLYTTKPAGRGSGLGLSVVQESVRELGGAIEVESAPGAGSTFRVFIPLANETAETTLPGHRGVANGPPTVLVVEDDAALRMALRRMLKDSGLELLLAVDAAEAEEVVRRHQGRIDILLTDLQPGGAGPVESIKRIRQLRPQLRVVVVSGQRPLAAEQLEDAVFVSKPFTATELLSAVAAAAQAESRSPVAAARKARILIVDDDDELRASLVRLLEESQLHAVGTKSGLHALDLLSSTEFDVLVSDQIMPGMDGVKLLELVAAKHPQIQRVLLTAHASADIFLDAVNRGRVARVLLKNMHPVQIRDEVAAIALDALRLRSRLCESP